MWWAARRNFATAVLVLGVVGAVHGLVYVPFAGPRLGDSAGYEAAAHAIRHGSYTTPLPDVDVTGLPIPASAQGAPERQTYRTPGYPLLLAAADYGGARPESMKGSSRIRAGLLRRFSCPPLGVRQL